MTMWQAGGLGGAFCATPARGGTAAMKEYPELTRHFRSQVAYVLLREGETQEAGWRRHLAEFPEQRGVTVRVFHKGLCGPQPRSPWDRGDDGRHEQEERS